MNDQQKQQYEEVREKLQHLWCQHCKALQKSNETLVVDCWYNALDREAPAFCAANCDAIDGILALTVSSGGTICPACNGTGNYLFEYLGKADSEGCQMCNGTGQKQPKSLAQLVKEHQDG